MMDFTIHHSPFTIHLEARDPARNIWRAYSITGGQDLFGDWVVVLSYGRIGAKGRTKTVLLADKEATRRYVRQCLKKRENAPKRIGIGYTVIKPLGIGKPNGEANRSRKTGNHPLYGG